MPYNIQTGQLDLGGLKEYLLRPASTSLSGSALNTTGFYPYTGNPADFSTYTQLTGISGDISGYIDSVSGVIRADLVESGTNLSGYTTSVKGQLKSDITTISGDVREVSGDLRLLSGVVYSNQGDIGNLGTNLAASGERLSVLITGGVGTGISGYLTGHVRDTSGILNTKVSNLDVSLRGHVYSDYLSKKDVGAGNLGISGQTTFHKNPHFNKGVYLDKVSNHSNFSTIQTGVGSYAIVEDVSIGGQNYQTMTNYMRFPQSGDSVRQDIIVSSLMYKGTIPL
jgi:hypothetical protein